MPNVMVERKLWFSRRFNFDVEPWAFPNLIERLRGTPARLEERLRGLDAATLTARIDGKWSIQENADMDSWNTCRSARSCRKSVVTGSTDEPEKA